MQNDRTTEQLISELHSLRQKVADLKASETKRQKGEEWFKGVLDSIQEAIIVVDNNGRIRSANLQTEKLFQYEREELYDQTVEILLPERLRGKHQDHRARYALNPKAKPMGMDVNFVGLRKDGSEFPADISLSPMSTDEDILFIAAIHDITDRKRADEALRKSEERFHKFFTHSNDAIFITDPEEDKILEVNPRACSMLGYSREEMLSMSVSDIHPVEMPQLLAFSRSVVLEGKGWTDQLTCLTKRGEALSAEISASTIDLDGRLCLLSMVRDTTERKVTEQKLRESEEKYRDIFESAHDVILLVDVEGTIVDINPRGELLTSYPRAELTGMNLFQTLVVSEDRENIRQALYYAARGEETRYEVRWQTKDKRIIHFEGATTSRKSETGEFLYTRCMLRDVTDRKRAEEQRREDELQLRESEERFRTIFEKAVAGIALVAIDGTFLKVNGRFSDIVGYHEDELLKLHWQNITYPPDVKTGEDKVRQVLTGEIQFTSFDKAYVKKDGSLVWVHLSMSLLRSRTGKPRYFISIIDDITDLRQSHETIRDQAELLEVTHDTIIVRDLEDRILYWNSSAENKYGWSKQEATGRKLSDLLFSHKQSQLQDAMKAIFRDGKWEGELRPLSKQERELIVDSRWTLVRDDRGSPKAILTVGTDVTEKKKTEEHLLRVQRMESIGALAAGIAHDLNNILAPVLLGVDVLRKNVVDDNSRRILSAIESSARRGSEVIKQLLLFGKGGEAERTLLQPAHVIHETEKILRETFPRNIRVEVKVPDQLWAILADMTQISQVLINLCVNARDAMPHGGTLTVSAENILLDEIYARMNVEAKTGPYVLVQIADSGNGIPKEILGEIFEPFFTTKPVGKGSGLGLATVLNLVRKHGGFLNVYSQVGSGTAFKIYLPALKTGKPSTPRDSRSELPHGNGELVLVVDDELSITEMAKEILELYGYCAITANDGTEAIALYASRMEEINLVLTDFMMPFMDGPSTIRALRRLNPRQKIIVMTGFAPDAYLEDLGDAVSQTITKPFTAELLLTTIRNVLSG